MKSLLSTSRAHATSCCLVGCSMLFALSSVNALSLPNSGFEAPDVGVNSFNSFLYQPVGASWTFSYNAGISGNNSGFTYGNPLAPEGIQVAFLQSGLSLGQYIDSSIEQVFSLPSSAEMQISFSAAQRARGSAGQLPNQQDFNVYLDDRVIGHFLPTTITYLPYSTGLSPVSAGLHVLKFAGINSVGSIDNTAFLDNVQVILSPIPEPETAELLLLGLGAMIITRKRGQRRMTKYREQIGDRPRFSEPRRNS